MAAITIRAATPQDEAMLTELIAASYATLGAGYEAGQLAAAMPVMSRPNPKLLSCGTYYIAECDAEPAACGGWTREKPGSGEIVEGVAYIRHFATHPAHLRKGIARILLDRCLAEAAAAGLRLMKSQATLTGEPFYAAAGFRRVGMIDVEMGPGNMLPAVDMERELG
jgi:GNAT superfamily N-acetyltransferase